MDGRLESPGRGFHLFASVRGADGTGRQAVSGGSTAERRDSVDYAKGISWGLAEGRHASCWFRGLGECMKIGRGRMQIGQEWGVAEK